MFFIKRSKLLKNGEVPIRVHVTYDRLYVELQLKQSIKVPLWSQEKEKSTGKDQNSVELNHNIDALHVKFYQIYQDLELEGKIISARVIVIADLCGIKKNLTTHTSRHSFASVIALANNMSLPNVAKMLKHSSTRMTQNYAKVLDQSILRDMQAVKQSLNL